MENVITLKPRSRTKVILRDAEDMSKSRDWCIVYPGWSKEDIQDTLSESLKEIEMATGTIYTLYLDEDSWRASETVKLGVVSIMLSQALQEVQEPGKTNITIILYTSVQSPEPAVSISPRGKSKATEEVTTALTITGGMRDTPAEKEFKSFAKNLLLQLWPRTHRDQEADGEVFGSFALQNARSRRGQIDKFFWKPGYLRVYYELHKEANRRGIKDKAKFTKFLTNYTNNMTSNLRRGKVTDQTRIELEASAEAYWDNYEHYILDSDGNMDETIRYPDLDEWHEAMKGPSRITSNATDGVQNNTIQAHIIESAGVQRKNNDLEELVTNEPMASSDLDLLEEVCEDDQSDAIVSSQVHRYGLEFDVTNQAELCKKIRNLERELSMTKQAAKELREAKKQWGKDNMDLVKAGLKQREKRIKELEKEIQKLETKKRKRGRPMGVQNKQFAEDDGRKYHSSAKDRAERRKRCENTHENHADAMPKRISIE